MGTQRTSVTPAILEVRSSCWPAVVVHDSHHVEVVRRPSRDGRNWVVYWLQRPKDTYVYVGITSSLPSRCEAHGRKGPVYEYAKNRMIDPKRLVGGITVFANLPPLSYDGVRQVEQALMERYGFVRKPDRRQKRGTLVNKNHSYDPARPAYCVYTAAGRLTLNLRGYADQASQRFAFSKDCPG